MASEGSKEEYEAALERIWADADADATQSLGTYLAMAPGFEREVAREYLAATTPAGDGAEEDTLIGPYRRVRELGRGGQGIVYLAEDTRLNRKVAVKVLTRINAQLPGVLERFDREARAASALEDPGICTVYDTGSSAIGPYMAMRYVKGVTLADMISRGRNPSTGELPTHLSLGSDEATAAEVATPPPRSGAVDGATVLIERVATTLHVAHEAGIYHRDIKPANIMVDSKGQPVLLDFGLARFVDDDSQPLTVTGDFFGTPSYMAPEQLAVGRVDVDRRADVYALGVTLYESMTLQRPFEAPTRRELYARILAGDPEHPRVLNPRMPADLATIILTAMDRRPDNRYKTALDLAQDLRRFRERKPIAARPPTRLVKVTRWLQRNPALTGVIIITLIGIAGASVVLSWLSAARSKAAFADQLRDEQSVRDVHRWAGRLWPPVPETIEGEDGMEAWLDEARRLQGRWPIHQALLDQAIEDDGRDTREARLRRSRLEETLRLISQLTSLIKDVEERRAFARTVSHRTITECASRWAEVESACGAGEPRLHGDVPLRPQMGLVPLGRDPESHLFEFAVLQTGEVPRRAADTGELVLSRRSALILVLIPGGPATVGSRNPLPKPNEHPWKTELAPYFIAKHEVTQAQYLRVMGTNPAAAKPGALEKIETTLLHPVEYVSWSDATEFCRRIGCSLPTEAQWEIACRAGTDTRFSFGNHPMRMTDYGNIADPSIATAWGGEKHTAEGMMEEEDGYPATAPVGSFRPNGFGILDMHGNVEEWCQDPYCKTPVDAPGPGAGLQRTDPSSVGNPNRVVRGGHWQFGWQYARSAKRTPADPRRVQPTSGIRVARAVQH